MTLFDHPTVQSVSNALKRIPGARALLQTNTWRSLRHRVALLTDERRHFTFTRFLRLPTQFEALTGPVLDFLAPAGTARPLEIVAVGCSIGAEQYSVASVLTTRRPGLQFTIRASDVDPEVIARARGARYVAKDVFANQDIPRDFVAATFDQVDGAYVVKPNIARRVSFEIADVLDPGLAQRLGTADVVLAQNLLYNFRPRAARRAFENICTLLRPRGALFIDGMDLGMRQRLTRRAGLVPLEYKIQEIHEDARRERAKSWPWHYWGLEPFDASRRDWAYRYAMVFLKDGPRG